VTSLYPTDDLIKKGLRSLEPYKAGLPDMAIPDLKNYLGLNQVEKMSFNESPFGPSPDAIRAMKDALTELHLYHDVDECGLRGKLSTIHGVAPEQILMGNGADEIAQMTAMAFLSEGDEAIIPQPTYIQYEVSTLTMGATPVFVPVKDFQIDLNGILQAITPKTKLIYLCNPNNPTGTLVAGDDLAAFVEALPPSVVLFIDEAYHDYVTDPAYRPSTEFLSQNKLVMGVRTFSKIHGLAAARVGYAIGPEPLIHTVARTRMQVNVNYMGLCGASASVDDHAHRQWVQAQVEKGKQDLYDTFNRMHLAYVPSQGNFIFLNTGVDSRILVPALAERGVVVRPGHLFGYPSYVRMTVGTDEQNRRFTNELAGFLAKNANI
jgi:histidinol-phosphate aminotransferase